LDLKTIRHLRSQRTEDLGLSYECVWLEVRGRKLKNKDWRIQELKFGDNDHPHSGWLEFSAIGRKGKSTSVL
jgi:hypothetical protein